MTDFYQIYYDEKQFKEIFPFAIPYRTQGLTVFFESHWIKELVLSSKAEKIGVCSWKLRQKLRWYIGQRRELTKELLETDYEVMTFTRNTKYHQMLAAAAAWHPGFLTVFDKILSKIGVTRPKEVKIPIYQNHFCCRTDIYKDYVNNYLGPAMDCIQNDSEINVLAMQNSKYSDLTNQSAEHLQEKLGINYYPLTPFLLERLFSIYVHNKRIAVTYL